MISMLFGFRKVKYCDYYEILIQIPSAQIFLKNQIRMAFRLKMLINMFKMKTNQIIFGFEFYQIHSLYKF